MSHPSLALAMIDVTFHYILSNDVTLRDIKGQSLGLWEVFFLH